MSEARQDISSASNVRRLSDVMREVKNANADRDDVVVEMREAQRMRLELLAQELEPVFAEVPEDEELFDFAISSGAQPRLWIDAVSHVTMGRDRRTYRFLRDTRLGRVVLAESTDMKPIADQVTRYIAERMLERRRLMEGDVKTLPRGLRVAGTSPRGESRWASFLTGLALVIVGGAVGIIGMLIYLSHSFPQLGIRF
jgi:hypothetical protein